MAETVRRIQYFPSGSKQPPIEFAWGQKIDVGREYTLRIPDPEGDELTAKEGEYLDKGIKFSQTFINYLSAEGENKFDPGNTSGLAFFELAILLELYNLKNSTDK